MNSSGRVALDEILKSGVRGTPDVDAFATKGDHEAAVMLWNYHDDDVAAPATEVEVAIGGVPVGVKRVLLEHYRIDETHSNAYTVWKAMGSPARPTQDQESKLKAAGQLEMMGSPEWVDVTAGEVRVRTEMPRQATSLLRIRW